jgi:hypothetical protein
MMGRSVTRSERVTDLPGSAAASLVAAGPSVAAEVVMDRPG